MTARPTRPGDGDRIQLLTFRVGDERFAADIFSVERVIRYTLPRPIPNVPAWLEGVLDYDSRVVPVIDLRARFELPPAPRERSRIMIVTLGADEWIGLVVDAVDDVTSVDAQWIAPPPPIFRGLARQYLRGLVRSHGDESGVIVLLDLAQLLSTGERIVLEQAVTGHAARG